MNTWAATYSGSVSFTAQNRITNNNNGTFTTASNAGNQYALALADLSGLENIASASSVTLEFDVTVAGGGRLLIGIGDKNTRGTTAGTSSKSTYDTNGLVMRYGTSDGTYVRVNGGTNNSNLLNASSHVTFTLDRTTGKYSYTITYVDGESVTQTGLSDSNISTSVSNATIVEAYTWLGSATITISDVSYSYEYSASSFDYTINAVDNEENIIKELASGTSTEAVSYYYPYAFEKDGVYYTTSASNFVADVTSLNPTVNIVYTRDESIVGFYEESTSGTNATCSNGAYATVAAQNKRDRGIAAGTLTPGVYKFMGHLVADGNSGRAITIREGANDPMASLIGNNSTKYTEAEFTVYATTGSLYINGANSGTEKTNLSTSFDYVLIKRIGDATVSKSISAAGWATYCSPYALDFSNVEGLTAYIVKGADAEGNLAKTEVTTVPANTGVLLKGAAGDYNISVVASSSTDVTDNKMVGVTAETKLAATGGWVLMDSPSLGFYCNTNEFTLGANTAYIPVDEDDFKTPPTEGAKTRFFSLDGEDATAINGIKGEKNADNAAIYNLAGQRVNGGYKGIVIKNGKKVFVK